MASSEQPKPNGPAATKLALEAVRLGEMLDANHPAEPGGLQSIGTCRTCGYLIFQAGDNEWRHLPSVEERDTAGKWLATHQHDA